MSSAFNVVDVDLVITENLEDIFKVNSGKFIGNNLNNEKGNIPCFILLK